MPAKVHVLPSMNFLTQIQHVTYPNIEAQSKMGPSPTSVEQVRLVVPHFRIKWNSPLNVFRKYSGGTLYTLSNQANYHRLGRVLNSPPLNSRCKNVNQEDLQEDVMGLRSGVRSGTYSERLELNSQRLGSEKHFHN